MLQLTRISAFIHRHFPEREFHYRSGGAVRYFRLSTEAQAATAGIVAFLACWMVIASVWLFAGSGPDTRQVRLEDRLNKTKALIAAAQAEQEALRQRLAALSRRNAQSAAELKRSREQFASALTLGKGLAPKPGKQIVAVGPIGGPLVTGLRVLKDQTGQRRPRTIFDTLKPSEERAISAGGSLAGFKIAGMMAQNRSLLAERERLWSRVVDLRAGLDRMRSGRAVLLTRLDKQTQQNIDEIERVVVMTGLDPDELLSRLNRNGQGGPEMAIPAAFTTSDEYAVRVMRLTKRLKRWENLQAVLRSMPLIAPLDHYRKSSGFGKRRDPMTGRWSSHNGMDFAYHRNSPVLSTAAGTVTFAGWRGGYGWMIEIDHGMGVRTRYAHLKKILVEKGQKLAFREKIGLLGSSGRSSGPHVHYEVVVDGRPRNPIKFITAGKYVFKR